MSNNSLFTAKKYQIELTEDAILHGGSREIFSNIFWEFEISTNADDNFDKEYDMYRSELVRLRDEIINETDYFKELAEFLDGQLDKLGITRQQFIGVLDALINQSDPENEMVLLCWY